MILRNFENKMANIPPKMIQKAPSIGKRANFGLSIFIVQKAPINIIGFITKRTSLVEYGKIRFTFFNRLLDSTHLHAIPKNTPIKMIENGNNNCSI